MGDQTQQAFWSDSMASLERSEHLVQGLPLSVMTKKECKETFWNAGIFYIFIGGRVIWDRHLSKLIEWYN